jgi:hypothetical protein
MTRDIADRAKRGPSTLRTRSTISPIMASYLNRLLLEQQVIAAGMLPTEKPVDVRALYEARNLRAGAHLMPP